jgi:phage portal protein BeeE
MGIFSRTRRAEQRTLRRESLTAVLFPSSVAGSPISDRSALGIVDVLACVRLLAESAWLLPLHAYRETAGGRERFDSAITDLLERPAPGTTQPNLVAQMVGSLALAPRCPALGWHGEDHQDK